ncbi:MATE family efflux transporter [Rhodovibrio salinarum]|uniref:MATE family efflux transporter n=1 Tax=Rhodovibrio salinarum TaxID=1087 RepID=A0A934QGD0_9PROT|nr:MATE family efflux transporter [Rhodovibrio salinarum]MBK1696364.1 MATE family efflux transporter [Rhodovibrio salinarum]
MSERVHLDQPTRSVWRLAVPIILSNLSTPLLGAVDTAVMGHLPDAAYLGAVAVGAMVFSFLYWGFGFLRMGTTGFAAQAFGAGQRDELRATLGRPLLLAGILGTLLIALQVPIGWVAFQLVESSPKVESFAGTYYAIRIWSAPFALTNYAVLGWLLGTQRARTALVLQIALNGTNVLLDLVFVLGLGWTIAGVAAASLIAEIFAAILGLTICGMLLRREGGRWSWERIADRTRLIALFRVNRDIFLRTLSVIFAFAYFTAKGAEMGETRLAANAILMQLQQFLSFGLDGFAHAAEILAGNAIGAKDRPAFRHACRSATFSALALAGSAALIFALGGPGIVRLFTDLAEVREAAATYLPWMVLSPLVSVWPFMLDGIFIGATRTTAMRNAMLMSLAVYFVACWTLIPLFDNHGLWAALMIFMATRALTLGWYFPALERSVGQRA